MSSQPSDRMTADRHPRHAAEPARHRRPESLADAPATPPVAAIWTGESWTDQTASDRQETRAARRRRAEADSHPADAEILAARRAAQRHSGLVPVPERTHTTGPSRVERRRQEREATRRAGRHKAPRGRHARPADPLHITVRPAVGTVREWTRADGGRAPVTGTRRAPGTLPIESWLLIGKTRQQVLLASLVAVGLALVMIPAAQRDEPVSPVNAAGQATVTTNPAGSAKVKPPKSPAEPAQRQKPTEKDRSTTKPPAAAPATSGGPAASAEVITVPAGDGPFQTLRTTGSATVALTFDDGPDPVQTPKILAMLAEYQVKATFCLVGEQVEKHPEIVREIVSAGHTLCNHTWDHSLTIGKDAPAVIAADLARTNQAIHNAVPDVEIPFFRAPGGNFSDRLVQVAYAAGMTSLYWEVDPRDWDHTKDTDDAAHVEKVVRDVRTAVKPGSIVLSHDFNQPDTISAYEQLLPWLAENFELGTPPVAGPA